MIYIYYTNFIVIKVLNTNKTIKRIYKLYNPIEIRLVVRYNRYFVNIIVDGFRILSRVHVKIIINIFISLL